MEVFCTSPWVPPEWIKAHGLEPRGIWLARDFACEPLPLAAGVCAFANAAVRLAEQQSAAAVVFTSHCDQLRRGFDAIAHPASARIFLFNLPVTWQTPVAERIFSDELSRLGRFLLRVGGHAPTPGGLFEIMKQHDQARGRLLAAAACCPARVYAEAVARFHLDGSVNLPPEVGRAVTSAEDVEWSRAAASPFPLTPALSLGEREETSHRVGESAAPGGLERRNGSRPVPEAERQGEGEGEVRPTGASVVSQSSCRRADPERGAGSIPLALVGGPLPQSQMPLLDAIEKAGGRVVLNATEAGERSLWATSLTESPGDDAFDVLVNRWLAHCVDVFQRPNSRLYDWLRPRLTERHARGILLWHYVNCDLWRAEAQPLREAFGLPVLLLDADEAALQRNVGRIEAFLESLR